MPDRHRDAKTSVGRARLGRSPVCIDAYETSIQVTADIQLTVASAVGLEPVRSFAAACANVTRDIGATQLSARALVPGRVTDRQRVRNVTRGALALYWESTGTGTPVLLIHGLGLSGGAWWRTVDALSPTLRVITFDHRGIGRSESLTTHLHDRGDGRRRRIILDELGLEPRTSTGSRSAAWSRSSWRSGTPSGSGRSFSARPSRAAGGPSTPMPRSWRSSAQRSRMDKEEAAWASVRVQLRRALPRRARRSHRRGHRTAAREAVQRAGLPGAAVRGSDAQLLRAPRPHPRSDVRGARGPRPRHSGRERASDGRAAPELPAVACSRTRATCTRPRRPRWTRRSAASSTCDAALRAPSCGL